MNTLKKVFSNNSVQVALWIGVSYLVATVLGALLNVPELSKYYGVINVVLFVLNELRNQIK